MTVTAYGADGTTTTKIFNLTVTTPASCRPFDALSFAPRVPFIVGNAPSSIAIGDFNGDGKQDIAAANQNSSSVSILLRNAANDGFDTAGNLSVNAQPLSVAVADFNGDGKTDIAVAIFRADNVSVLLRNAANDGFDAVLIIPSAMVPPQ